MCTCIYCVLVTCVLVFTVFFIVSLMSIFSYLLVVYGLLPRSDNSISVINNNNNNSKNEVIFEVSSSLTSPFMVLISLVSVLNLLYFYISTFRSMCAAPNMAVFRSSLTSCFPGMLLTYFLNEFEIVPVAPIITSITFVFTFHKRCISIVRSLYFRIFSTSLLLLLLLLQIIFLPLSLFALPSTTLRNFC